MSSERLLGFLSSGRLIVSRQKFAQDRRAKLRRDIEDLCFESPEHQRALNGLGGLRSTSHPRLFDFIA